MISCVRFHVEQKTLDHLGGGGRVGMLLCQDGLCCYCCDDDLMGLSWSRTAGCSLQSHSAACDECLDRDPESCE